MYINTAIHKGVCTWNIGKKDVITCTRFTN